MRSEKSKLNIQQMRQQLLNDTLNSPQTKRTSPASFKQHLDGSFSRFGRKTSRSPPSGYSGRQKYESSLFEPYNFLSDTFQDKTESPGDQSILKSVHQLTSFEQMLDVSASDLGSASILVEKDPEIFGSGVLFSSFRESLEMYPHAGQVFDLTANYEKLCREHSQKLLMFIAQVDPTGKRFQRTNKMINQLYQECYTWRLIGSLIKDRLQTEDEQVNGMDTEESLINEQFPSFKKAVDKLFSREPSARYCQLIVDWLEKNAEDKLNDFIATDNIQFASDSISWEHTLHKLKQSFDVKDTHRIITEMDPDAPIRQKRLLADLDEADDAKLIKFVFMFLRAGKLDDAKKLCMKYGQSWRAATLDGWRLWHDPNFDSNDNEINVTEGNPFGLFWKVCCWKLCEDKDVNIYEKAVYAALSGNLQQLLKICKSWEDCLWAFFKVLVDGKVELELRLLSPNDAETLPKEYYEATEELTPQKIFDELESHQDKNVQAEGKEIFHVFQKLMILDEPKILLKEMESLIDNKSRASSHMLRFVTHVVLFFQSAGLELSEDLYVKVLQNYIATLIAKNLWEQVALYTAKLPSHLQVETYAEFLEKVEAANDREHYAELAKKAGLDVNAITKQVVENIRESNPDEMQVDSGISTGDAKKIESINWLILEPNQHIEAVLQANAIIRGFLSSKKLEAAKEVFKKLPKDSIDIIHKIWETKAGSTILPPEYENAKKEYLCIKAYLDAHSAFDAWFKHYHNNAPKKPKKQRVVTFKDQITYEASMKEYTSNYEIWKKTLDTHVAHVSDKIYNVLLFPEGWMVDVKLDEDQSSSRQMQLKHIQVVSIPLLCLLLQSVLHSSGKYKECLQIADVIQGEQRKLYTAFSKTDLQKLIGLLKDSSLSLLNEGQDFLGYDIAEQY